MLNFPKAMTSYLPREGQLFTDLSADKTEILMPNESHSHRRLKVLVFATDENERLLYKTLFEMWKYEAEEAKTVEEVREIVHENHFDVILMDTSINISESFSLMRKLRADDNLEATHFVLLSGHAQPTVRESALTAGASGFCVKPVDFADLKLTLDSCHEIAAGNNKKLIDLPH